MNWTEVLRYSVPSVLSVLVTIVIMLVRERNSFSVKMMDLFIADKTSWVEEREKLEKRIDGLYEKCDKLQDKYEELLRTVPRDS